MIEFKILNEIRIFIVRGMSITLITAIPGTILLAVYFVTSPKIAEYHEIKLKKSVLEIFDIPYHTEEKKILGFKYKKFVKEDIRDQFDENITIETLPTKFVPGQPEGKKGRKLFKYYKERKLQGIGFVVTKFGYGFNKAADITLFICVGPDLETIMGIEPLDHAETPGLGGRMTEDAFKKQFVGKKLTPKLSFVRVGKETGDNEVHAITGASYTSKGVEKIINEAMQAFWKEMGVERG